MFSNVLVPVDLTDRNGRPVRTAVELAAATHGRVTLVHVIQRIAGLSLSEGRGFYARLEKKAAAKLAALAKRRGKSGVEIRGEVLIGSPATDIARYAARHDADLIVMASHRVDPKRPGHGLGTTSYKVAILCTCPVLLVK
jgi:nucleotide-binding universal stress UspA family protein